MEENNITPKPEPVSTPPVYKPNIAPKLELEPKPKSVSVLAIVGFIISILAILGSWILILNNISFVFAIISLILGVISLVLIKNGKKVGLGLAIATIIISIIAGGIAVVTQAFYVKVFDEAVDSVNEAIDNIDGTNTEKLLDTSIDVVFGEFIFDPGDEADYSYDDTSELVVTIKNKASEKASYTVKIEAVNDEGNRISDDTVYVSDLNPGQSITEKAFIYIDSSQVELLKNSTFKVLEVSKY